MLSLINFPEGRSVLALGDRQVDEREISWLLEPPWRNVEGRFHC